MGHEQSRQPLAGERVDRVERRFGGVDVHRDRLCPAFEVLERVRERRRFATHLRTWLLIAALTALLIAIGAAIGGGALYLFVVLAVGMNLVGYWFSDKLALKASRAQPLEPGQAPWLRRMVEDLAHRAEVPVPRLYLIPSEQPNAFATGPNGQHAAVAVTEGLLERLPADQVRGVLAHEFAHIKNHDILISSIAAMLLQPRRLASARVPG